MSVRLMNRVFDSSLPQNLKFIALGLADHADDNEGNIYPGVKRLARRLSLSPRAVKTGLKKLEVDGILIRQADGGGRSRTTKYAFDVEALARARNGAETSLLQRPETVQSTVGKRCSRIPETVKVTTERVQFALHDPLDPSEDPSQNKSTGARAPAVADPRTPTFGKLCVLAKEIVQVDPNATYPDHAESMKMRCAQLRLGYSAEAVKNALDAVLRPKTLSDADLADEIVRRTADQGLAGDALISTALEHADKTQLRGATNKAALIRTAVDRIHAREAVA